MMGLTKAALLLAGVAGVAAFNPYAHEMELSMAPVVSRVSAAHARPLRCSRASLISAEAWRVGEGGQDGIEWWIGGVHWLADLLWRMFLPIWARLFGFSPVASS
jgi:hypothetical protein